MSKTSIIRVFGLGAALTLTLASCGGGGGGGSSSITEPTANTISVRPSLGCFRNVEVDVFDISKGEVVGTGRIPSSGCDASINLSSYSGGPVILKAALLTQPPGFDPATYCNDVQNAACFFNEGTLAWEPFVYSSGLESLLAPLPELDPSKTYGINKITNALATALNIPSNFDSDPAALQRVKASITKESVNAEVSNFIELFQALGVTDLLSAPRNVAASSADVDAFKSSTSFDAFSALFLRDALENNPLQSALTFSSRVASGENLSSVFSTAISDANSFVRLNPTERTSLIQERQADREQEKSQVLAGNNASGDSSVSGNNNTGGSGSASGVAVTRTQTSFLDSGNDVAGSAETSTLRVVPMLGQFSAGAVVELIEPLQGAVIAASQVQELGYADIEMPATLQSSFIVKVSNAQAQASVTYFDVGLSVNQAISSQRPLYALVPTNSRPTTGVVIGVTPVTDMAAALVGVGPTSETIAPEQGVAADARESNIATQMFAAYARALYMLGWTSASLTSSPNARYQLNPLLPPVRLSAQSIQNGIDIGQAGGLWAVFFAELARNSLLQNYPNFLSFIQSTSQDGEPGLRLMAESIRGDLNDGGLASVDFSTTAVASIIRSVNNVVADGSQYENECIEVTPSVLAPITSVFSQAAVTNPKSDFDPSVISRLASALREDTATLLTGSPKRFSLSRQIKVSCAS